MAKPDNSTPHLATLYDEQIRCTIPFYDSFHDETINLIKASGLKPECWLDTGCGTGSFVEKALNAFPVTWFILADPSAEMLSVASRKLSKYIGGKVLFLDPAPTQSLPIANPEKIDVVTAIQSHHYLLPSERVNATKVCFELLRKGGIYVTFENIRPFTSRGTEIGKNYWRNFQLANKKDAEAVEKHMLRFGVEYFPITVEEHLSLLRNCGFSVVELLWYSYMQAGFYCIK